MADKQFEKFRDEYSPVAKQAGEEIGVDPNILLSQWGMETGWGQKIVPGTHNLGNVKDFSGKGKEAVDNKTKTKDKYLKFEDPEVFGMYYADLMKRLYPKVINTGTDVGAFTRGLAAGKNGSYFEDDPEDYNQKVAKIYAMFPEAGDIKPAPKVVEKKVEDTTQDKQVASMNKQMDDQEIRQAQLIGGGAGAALSGLGAAKTGVGNALQAGAQRIGAGYSAGVQGGLPSGTAPAAGGLPGTPSQVARIQAGTMGDLGTTGQARMTGFNTETAQKAAAEKQMADVIERLKARGIAPDSAKNVLANAPGLTSTPAGVLLPKSELPTYTGPRGPGGEVGFSTRPTPPTFSSKVVSGLDAVTNTFKRMMESPVGRATGALAKFAALPLAAADIAGQGTQIMQELRKPDAQQDFTKMGLNAARGIGAGLSVLPGGARVGIPIALGAMAGQQLNDPESRAWMQKQLERFPQNPDPANPIGSYGP